MLVAESRGRYRYECGGCGFRTLRLGRSRAEAVGRAHEVVCPALGAECGVCGLTSVAACVAERCPLESEGLPA